MEPDFAVTSQAGSLGEARRALLAVRGRFDLALVDLRLPDGDGVDLVREFRRRHPRGRALVLTSVIDPVHHRRAIEAGALRVISKAAHPGEIVSHLRLALRSETECPNH